MERVYTICVVADTNLLFSHSSLQLAVMVPYSCMAVVPEAIVTVLYIPTVVRWKGDNEPSGGYKYRPPTDSPATDSALGLV